jgi:glycosyltransferase involved in cell wall biosynthesis
MKLIVQIPCLNEEGTLPQTVKDIPRTIAGVDKVEILVIDDGSSDRTSEVARQLGVDHIVRHPQRLGLGRAFKTGLDETLALGADIIVNTDADNQYHGGDIPKLIAPILEGRADLVIGNREVHRIDHFSPVKRFLQQFGSLIVRVASNTDVPDAASGFRAYSREAALRLHIFGQFSHTLETLIQAGRKGIAVTHVTVRTNEPLRESRLFKSLWEYLMASMTTIVRIYAMYKPLPFFFGIGALLIVFGLVLVGRFVYFHLTSSVAGHVQSVILAGVLLVIGFQIILIGLLADLIAGVRSLLEEILYRSKKHQSHTKG